MKLVSLLVVFFCFLSGFNTTIGDPQVETEERSNHSFDKEIVLGDLHEDCYQPKEIGRCFAIFHRYAFNSEKLICEEFIYGGCMGNKNNFETLADCERVCLKKETDTNPKIDVDSSTELIKDDKVIEK